MRVTVVTIFPEMFEAVLGLSMLGRAREASALQVDFVDPRDFTTDRHRSVDDTPYGGGPGMVMKVEPLVAAIESLGDEPRPHRVLLTPVGRRLDQERVEALAAMAHVVLVCGRYEGIDERVSELVIDEELSLGDFVLTGGEIAAMAVIDAVARYLPGVLGQATSTDEESFSDSLLEYPQYTRPAEFRGLRVPDVLLSGHHGRIATWRRARALERTAERRPDLLAEHVFSDEDRVLWRELGHADLARRTFVALVHHPVYDRNQDVVTSAITNLDLHDIARSCATYGLGGYFMVTPVAAQREKAERIVAVWQDGISQAGADNRAEALEFVSTAADIAQVTAAIAHRAGRAPLVVATSARRIGTEDGQVEPLGFEALRARAARDPRPLLILLGTGWGLTDAVIAGCDAVLAPVSGIPAFNHLSVRSAAAIILDRLFGARGCPRT